MKHPILIAVLAGAASGAVAAVLTTSLASGPAGPQRSADGVAAAAPAHDAAIREGLEAIAAQLEALEVRVQMLAERPEPALAQREPVAVPATAEQERLEEEMRKLVAAMQDPGGEIPEALWQGVNTALQDIREQEERERDARREERALERIEERLASLSVELGLDGRQTDELRETWRNEMDRMNETFAQARESGDFFAVRDSVREIRQETSDAVSLILTPDQYEKYQELSPGGAFGFGGRGGRGGFGGPGGPGTPGGGPDAP